MTPERRCLPKAGGGFIEPPNADAQARISPRGKQSSVGAADPFLRIETPGQTRNEPAANLPRYQRDDDTGANGKHARCCDITRCLSSLKT
jgi:hypothetical protein